MAVNKPSKSKKNSDAVSGRKKRESAGKKPAGRSKPEKLKPVATAAGSSADVYATEQRVEESKFFNPSVAGQVLEPEYYELPAGYGDNRIVIQVRDPYWVHAYWEITQDKMNHLRRDYGEAVDKARRILRVFDVTGISFNGSNSNDFFDIDINAFASNWYINVGKPGRAYCVELSLILPDGRYLPLVRSNTINTPSDGPSWITDEEWMVLEEDFNKLYGMSAGLGIGLSSAELKEKIRQKGLSQVSSGALFSVSSPGGKQEAGERKFWLVVNAELIVYGATDPEAAVTVQGRPIKLREDGTFSLRFSLPDGEQVIPVKAISPDKVEERTITPVVTRKTV